MTEIETSLDEYCSSYDTLGEDILIGVEEGFREGLKEGIKEGFKEGVLEVKTTGLIISTSEAWMKSLKTSSRRLLRRLYTRRLSGQLVMNIRQLSALLLNRKWKRHVVRSPKIRNANVELNKISASASRTLVDASVKRIKDSISNSCEKIRKKLSNDMIMGSFLEGLQDGFVKDLDENLGACEKKIIKEIDNKIAAVQPGKNNINSQMVKN